MFKTNPVSMSNLLDEARQGKLQLPDFQRGWVWDDDRIRSLLSSIAQGFPIGAVLTLESGGEIRLQHRVIEGVGLEARQAKPDALLLDGQQRLTSLYQALVHSGTVHTRDRRGRSIERRYYIDLLKYLTPGEDPDEAILSIPPDRKVTKNFGREIHLDLSTREREFAHHMMPTEALLNITEWLYSGNDSYQTYWIKQDGHPWNKSNPTGYIDFCNKVNELSQGFSNYAVPVIELSRDTRREAVCSIFEKVNTGGVTLSVFELVTATFAAEGFDLRQDWEDRLGRLRKFETLRELSNDQFLQSVALLVTQEQKRKYAADGNSARRAPAIGCKRRDILNLTRQDYRKWADQVEEGFRQAARFLRKQYIFFWKNVPYSTQLTPLAAIFVELGETPDIKTNLKLERWYWSGVMDERYSGAVETQFALDLTEVPAWIRGGDLPRLVSEASFDANRLLSLRTRNSAAYKGIYALQMKYGAVDWRTGDPLPIQALDQQDIDIHHIFPQHWCEKARIPRALFNSIINKTPVDASTNRSIGGRAPSVYLKSLEKSAPPQILDRILEKHWIASEHLKNDDFVRFFDRRAKEILRLIGQAMGKDVNYNPSVFMDEMSRWGLEIPSELKNEIPPDLEPASLDSAQ